MFQNISARVSETVSVVCPVCGVIEHFRPIVETVQIMNAQTHVKPMLRVVLQPGNLVAHQCMSEEDVNSK